MFSFGANAATPAFIHLIPLGITEATVRTVSFALNTPPPTNVQPGW